MTITAVGTQEGGGYVDNSATATRAFGASVAANNFAMFGAARFTTTSKPFTAGNCTKSAGTATIGTPVLANSKEINPSAGIFLQTGIWLVPITGAGSLTLQIAGGDAGSFWTVASGEYHSDVAGTVSVEAAPAGTTGTGTSAATSSATSAGVALFWAAIGSTQGNQDSIGIQAPYTDIFQGNDGLNHQAGDFARHIVASGTSEAVNWTLGGSNTWSAVSAVIKVAAATSDTALSISSTATLTSDGRGIFPATVSIVTAVTDTYVGSTRKTWRVPTTASNGTAVHVIVFSGTSPTYAILAQGTATVDSNGYAQIDSSGNTGDKAFAFVHDYNDDTATTSIFGGAAIGTVP